MKKVCVFIDKNLSWCLILFTVVFAISSWFTPTISSPYNDVLIYLFPFCFLSPSLFLTDFGFIAFLSIGLLISTITLTIITLRKNLKANWLYFVFSCFSVLMLALTFFIIIWLMVNYPYHSSFDNNLWEYFIIFLPSEIGFIFCTFFSMTFCIYKYMQKPKKTPKPTKKQRIDELQKQIQDLQQKINNNEKTE